MTRPVQRDSRDERIEDLEESLRLIVTCVMHDGCHAVTDRDEAVLMIALDRLGLDEPVLHMGRGTVHAWIDR